MGKVIRPGRGSSHFFLTSFATALLLFLAMPGHIGLWLLLFVALVPMLSFIVQESPGRSFRAGLFTGFVYHVSMLYWIVIVLGRYGGLPPFISVPALLLLSLYMAIYLALFCWIFSRFLSRKMHGGGLPPISLFAAPALWVGLDWLRSVLFTGFPWMDLGYGLALQPFFIQVADLGGHHLVTFLIVMVNVLILYLIGWKRQGNAFLTRQTRLAALMAMGVLICSGGYSIIRYYQMSEAVSQATQLQVGVVQGNIEQLDKWEPDHKQTTLDRYLELSEKLIASNAPSLIVWPETAIPFFPGNDPLFTDVRRWTHAKDVWLLTGAPHFELDKDLLRSSKEPVKYYNSALLVDPSGNVAGQYAKQHLVPFGEYVPLRNYLPFLDPLVESVGNFSVGRSTSTLSAGETELGILICYESIFPQLARKKVLAGAEVLVNITNDAWYGRSSAPYQSFSMAALRAVETRRSMIRAANTGISGFVDPVGRVIKESPIFVPLSLSVAVPVVQVKTVFVRLGYLFGPSCLILSLLVLAGYRKQK